MVGRRDVTAAVSAEIAKLWRRLGVVVVTDTGPYVDDWLAANSATAAVIRPDRYTFAVAGNTTELETATKDLARIMSTQEVST
ncbi:hypothetical protein [Microbispora sp. NPDC046933]|uniref:hypothetical protein n=1 Tax=Microbispora sp. NPDC046933 TaxID=3155618 RepID=UPI00340E3C7E